MNFNVNNKEKNAKKKLAALIPGIGTIFIDQLPTFHVSRRIL
jgi:hypothetical protein